MECQKKLLADLAIIQDPETTPGSHHTEVLSLYILAGTMLLSSIIMLTKSLGRRMLSDIFFLVFFFVGALGFGLLGFASQVYVAGENWAVILAKILITLSLASLLLNNCCVLEDLAPFRFRTVIWVSFFFQSSVSLLGVAAQLGKHLQGTMLFMTMMSVSCTFTWSVAHYLKKSNAQEYCLKAFCSFLAAAGSLTVAILEPTCGYAGHKKCYTDCFGVPGVHFLIWVVPSIGSVLFLNFLQMSCPDQAMLPPILCWKPKPPPELEAPPAPLPPVPEPDVKDGSV